MNKIDWKKYFNKEFFCAAAEKGKKLAGCAAENGKKLASRIADQTKILARKIAAWTKKTFAACKAWAIEWKRTKGKEILPFLKKNIRYVLAGCCAFFLVVTLAVTSAVTTEKKHGSLASGISDTVEQMEEFKEAPDEITSLIESYYTAYAAGDTEAIAACADPVSDLEKGYITLMSQYIDSYQNITCYVKPGVLEKEYAVSVRSDIAFTGIATTAPGLDFFYIREDQDGAYKIDNRYSSFNLENCEYELDSQIEDFIEDYELQEDEVALVNKVSEEYETALDADADLKKMTEETIRDGIRNWLSQQETSFGEDGTNTEE